LPHGNGMPKTTIPEKLLNRSTNHLTSRFEIIPSDMADTNNNTDERELIIERAQRDSAKKILNLDSIIEPSACKYNDVRYLN
jgi:hypothetical protein